MTPAKLKSLPWEETVRISRDYALAAIDTLARLPRGQAPRALRFIYMSGHFAPRERTAPLKVLDDNGMTEYGFLRVCVWVPGAPLSNRAQSYIPVLTSSARAGRGRGPRSGVRRGVGRVGAGVYRQIRVRERPGQGGTQGPWSSHDRAAGCLGSSAGPGRRGFREGHPFQRRHDTNWTESA